MEFDESKFEYLIDNFDEYLKILRGITSRKEMAAIKRGMAAGVTWAESGQSIEGVEAVARLFFHEHMLDLGGAETELEVKLRATIDDPEFYEHLDDDSPFRTGWYLGVVQTFGSIRR